MGKRTAKTLRKLPPCSRQLAKYLNEMLTAAQRIDRLVPRIAELERECLAWDRRQEHYKEKDEVDPLDDRQIHRPDAIACYDDLFY